jgi:hypothetical protein
MATAIIDDDNGRPPSLSHSEIFCHLTSKNRDKRPVNPSSFFLLTSQVATPLNRNKGIQASHSSLYHLEWVDLLGENADRKMVLRTVFGIFDASPRNVANLRLTRERLYRSTLPTSDSATCQETTPVRGSKGPDRSQAVRNFPIRDFRGRGSFPRRKRPRPHPNPFSGNYSRINYTIL